MNKTCRSIVAVLVTAWIAAGCIEKEPAPAAAPAPAAENKPAAGPAPEPPKTARAFDPMVPFTLVSAANGKCVQFQRGGTANLATAEIATCDGSKAQQFRLQAFFEGYYNIINVLSNKCVDLSGFSMDDGAPAIQFPCHGQHNQQWVVSDSANGAVRLAPRHSGKPLAVKDGASADGTPVVQSPSAATPNQEFKLVPASPVAAAAQAKGAGLAKIEPAADKAAKGAKKIAADKPATGGAAPR